jgi:lysophospholipase L1-like esterase
LFENYEDEVRALERGKVAVVPPAPVVFYGSSSFRLWNTLGEDSPEVPIVNLGFGGSTLAACVHYFDRLVTPCHPRSVVFYAGDNDLGDGRMPNDVVVSFRYLHSQVASLPGNIPFAFLSIKPSIARWGIIGRIRETNDRIRQEIASRPQSRYIDIYTPMLNDQGKPRRELFLDDGLHLSTEGYRVWWQTIAVHRSWLFHSPPPPSESSTEPADAS